jgi:hypothetical protein
MTLHRRKRRLSAMRALGCAALAILFLLGAPPLSTSIVKSARAQISDEIQQAGIPFHEALAPYGEWRHSSRWGDVWVPQINADWRPYTVGHWIYTDDWGWYWVAAERETEWGLVVYHYGRWLLDPDFGWIWAGRRETKSVLASKYQDQLRWQPMNVAD